MGVETRDELTRVAAVDEVPSGRFLIVEVDGVSVGIARAGDDVIAVRNQCPHHGAPICVGPILGTMLPSETGTLTYGLDGGVLVCPWHHFEFSLDSGRPLFTDVHGRLRMYDVAVIEDDVYVNMNKRAQRRPSAEPAAQGQEAPRA